MLLTLRRDLRIVHHVPGRLRVKLGAAALRKARGYKWPDYRQALDELAGMCKLRLSPESLSAIVEYDCHRLPQNMWTALIEGSDDDAMDAFNRLAVHVRTTEEHDDD